MKEKVVKGIAFVLSFALGTAIGNVASSLIWLRQRHLCECEYCKTARQREAVEIVDSIIHERIVISVNKQN